MKLAFCIYRYFPFGGAQRDLLHIAEACRMREHEVHIWTTRWDSDVPSAIPLHFIPSEGWSNHRQLTAFNKKIKMETQAANIDAVIAFNKLPSAQIYYAADTCLKARLKERTSWLSILPRYRTLLKMEKNLFTDPNNQIIYISPREKAIYQQAYDTKDAQLHWLGPGLSEDRCYPDNAISIRQNLRQQYQLSEDERMLLMVGSSFATKGLDRAILALANLPQHLKDKTCLFVIGQGKEKLFRQLAKQNKVASKVKFLGARTDVPDFLLAADCVLQPSVVENTGTTIVEAMNAGCPVIATANCGYANFIDEAEAGLVVPSPFQQSQLNQALMYLLDETPQQRFTWGQQGRDYMAKMDLFSFPERAAKLIESLVMR